MPRLTSWLASRVVVLTGAAQAGPVVIDFEDLKSVDASVRAVGAVYAADGFTFTAFSAEGSDNQPNFGTAGTLSTTFYGSTALFNINGNGPVRLTRSDGGLFNFLSLDLIETPNFHSGGWPPIDLGSFTLTFFGTRADGSTVQLPRPSTPSPT